MSRNPHGRLIQYSPGPTPSLLYLIKWLDWIYLTLVIGSCESDEMIKTWDSDDCFSVPLLNIVPSIRNCLGYASGIRGYLVISVIMLRRGDDLSLLPVLAKSSVNTALHYISSCSRITVFSFIHNACYSIYYILPNKPWTTFECIFAVLPYLGGGCISRCFLPWLDAL